MHPMRLITYALLTGVVSLVAMGGVGFYVGYSAGRGDLSELKALIAAGGSAENAAVLAEALKQQSANQAAPVAAPAPAPAPEVNLSPVLDEIRSMSAQIGKLEKNATPVAPPPPQVVDRIVEKVKEDPKTKQELASVKQLLSEANDQFQGCKQNLTTLEAKLEEVKNTPPTQVAMAQPDVREDAQPAHDPASVVLFDNVLLKRDQKKVYNDVDVALSLNSIASRSAKVVVNQQALGISFGERKIFQHRDVTCELVLMETDLEGGKARFSIACKRWRPDAMPLIYFLRHGETDWNAVRRVQGHLDAPLNDKGRGQAARNGRVLAEIIGDKAAFDYVSSPLVRASETMEIVRREIGLDPKGYRTDLRLREYNLGDWQGHLYDDIVRDRPELIAERDRDPWNFLHPGAGGESFALLSARVLAWLGEIERDTVATAHGGVMRCLRRHFLGLDAAATFELDIPQDKVLRIDNGALSWV